MSKSLNPYDFGNNFQLVENCQKISVDDLVRIATKDLKKRIVEAQIEALGINLNLTTTSTRFAGQRLCFQCPVCTKRIRTIYQTVNGSIACRACLGLKYKKRRYKGMIEQSIL